MHISTPRIEDIRTAVVWNTLMKGMVLPAYGSRKSLTIPFPNCMKNGGFPQASTTKNNIKFTDAEKIILQSLNKYGQSKYPNRVCVRDNFTQYNPAKSRIAKDKISLWCADINYVEGKGSGTVYRFYGNNTMQKQYNRPVTLNGWWYKSKGKSCSGGRKYPSKYFGVSGSCTKKGDGYSCPGYKKNWKDPQYAVKQQWCLGGGQNDKSCPRLLQRGALPCYGRTQIKVDPKGAITKFRWSYGPTSQPKWHTYARARY